MALPSDLPLKIRLYEDTKLAAKRHCQPGMSCPSEDTACVYIPSNTAQQIRMLSHCRTKAGTAWYDVGMMCTGSFKSPYQIKISF